MSAMEDKQAIYQLLARYCFLLDYYRLSDLAAMFTSDGEWISGDGTARGPQAIEELLRGLVAEAAPASRRKHLTTNIIIELFGDRAAVTSNFLVMRGSEGGPVTAVVGTYNDVVVKTAQGWKFKSRRLLRDTAGESGLKTAPR